MIWKNIENYKDIYSVSTNGDIYSHSWKRIMVGKINKNGYRQIILCSNNKRKTKLVHRIVAETFIENPNNYPCVNHINGDKQDNRVENLEWCNYSHNTKEAYRLGLEKIYKGSDNKRSIKINQYDLNGNLINTFNGIKEAGRILNICPGHISKCCKGKMKTAYKSIWKYAEEV